MLPNLPPMCSPIVNAINCILISVLILTACRATPTPIATPVATLVATKAAAIPTALAIATQKPIVAHRTSATPTPAKLTEKLPEALTILTGTATLSSFIIPLPAEWHHVRLTDQKGEEQFQRMGAVNADLLPLVQRFLIDRENEQDLLVAWPTDPRVGIGLIGYLLPRRDLSLQRYLTAFEQALESTPTVTLHEAAVQYILRKDVPVGYLHYTLAAPSEAATVGHQYLLFDEEATELLLLTFITNATAATTTLIPTPVALSPTSVSAVAAAPPFADIIQGVSR